MVNNSGITLNDYQVDAVAACAYQGWLMGDFLDAYKEYEFNESIRNYSTGRGTSNIRLKQIGACYQQVYIDLDGENCN